MKLKWLLGSIAVALTLTGCAATSDDGETDQSQASEFGRLIASRDGSLRARIPRNWSRVRDSYPLALLTLASGPVSNRVIGPCQPGAVLDELPKGGTLVQVTEIYPPIRPISDAVGRVVRNPGHIRLGPPNGTTECGESYGLVFATGHRQFSVKVWLKPVRAPTRIDGERARASRPRRLAPATRRQLLRLLNGLVVAPAAAKPVRTPFLALDCPQANRLGCDRIYVDLTTRVRMRTVAIRIRRWSAKTPNGSVDSGPIESKPTRLHTIERGPNGSGALSAHTFWRGSVADAGLLGGDEDFKTAMPGPGQRWVGTGMENDPLIRADLEVIGPQGRWQFQGIPLIAGYG
jgi:hypothetical protein